MSRFHKLEKDPGFVAARETARDRRTDIIALANDYASGRDVSRADMAHALAAFQVARDRCSEEKHRFHCERLAAKAQSEAA